MFAYNNEIPEIKERDDKENDELQDFMDRSEKSADGQFPTTLSVYKKHPLYCIEKFANKFETIYPLEPVLAVLPSGDKVYPRSCLKNLHTAERWLREVPPRVVKAGEESIKVVKSHPMAKKEVTALYGMWQTAPYKSEPVKDGIVPRNKYGNIELFSPDMLPEGGCYLDEPGIQRTAKKLGIDFAPAVIGWEVHICRPKISGIVVPADSKQILLDAYTEEMKIKIEKEVAIKERKIICRWKRFTRMLLTRHRLKQLYEKKDETITVDANDKRAKFLAKVSEKKHEHTFPDESKVYDEESKMWQKTCSCGFVITFEEI